MSVRKIKIFAPIDRVKEVLPLIKAGADEFFCGAIINGETLGTIRQAGDIKQYNLPDITELEKAVTIAKKNNRKIYLTFNSPVFNLKRKEIISNNLEKLKKIGLNGIIVGDIDLMDRLQNCGLEIIASSLLETKNEETAKLLIKKFKVKRIILDRQITLDDLKNIVPKFPTTEFETFIMASGCRSLASACHRHLATKKKYLHIHLCCSHFSIEDKNRAGHLSSADKKIITNRLRMPPKCCGACGLFQFREHGITSVKIVGRGHLTETKIQNTKFIKNALSILEKNYSQEEFYKKIERLFEKTFNEKCQRRYCYYPHFFNQ